MAINLRQLLLDRAARGIGRSCVEALCETGAFVTLSDINIEKEKFYNIDDSHWERSLANHIGSDLPKISIGSCIFILILGVGCIIENDIVTLIFQALLK